MSKRTKVEPVPDMNQILKMYLARVMEATR